MAHSGDCRGGKGSNRGSTVNWFHVPPGRRSVAEKLGGLVTLGPGLVAYHTARTPPGFGSPQAVVAAHSYMAPYLASLPPDVPRVLDFQNLEWRSLGAIAGGWSRAAYLRGLQLLMAGLDGWRSGEHHCLSSLPRKSFSLRTRSAPRADKLFIPNVLPRESPARRGNP